MIQKNYDPIPLCRIYYELPLGFNIDGGNFICIDEIIDVVNQDYENVITINNTEECDSFNQFNINEYDGLNNLIIDFVTDASKYKIGKFTPLTRIPIYSDNALKTIGKKICAIPLAWNLSYILEKKLKKINKNIIFLRF